MSVCSIFAVYLQSVLPLHWTDLQCIRDTDMGSAVLTQIELECTCSVPKVSVQCRLNIGWISFAVLTKGISTKV